MKARKRGAIVNVGSGSATFLPSYPLYAVYGATKVSLSTSTFLKLSAWLHRCVYQQQVSRLPLLRSQCRPAPFKVLMPVQAYVDELSRDLHAETAAFGVTVENQAPFYVATKMSKIRKPRLDAPSPAAWVRSQICCCV